MSWPEERDKILKKRDKKKEAWNQLFLGLNPQQIADVVNEKYLHPDYKFVVIPTEAFSGINHIDLFKCPELISK